LTRRQVQSRSRRIIELQRLLVLLDAHLEAAFLIGLECLTNQVHGGSEAGGLFFLLGAGSPGGRTAPLRARARGARAAAPLPFRLLPLGSNRGGDAVREQLRVGIDVSRRLEGLFGVVGLTELRCHHPERDVHLSLDGYSAALLDTDRELVLKFSLRRAEAARII